MQISRPHINMSIGGHSDSGMSMLAGHLLYQKGNIDKRNTFRFDNAAKQIDKQYFKYSWLMQSMKNGRYYWYHLLSFSSYDIQLFEISQKGVAYMCRDRNIKSICRNMNQVDILILMVSVIEDEFQKYLEEIKTNIIIAFAIGVQIIFCINKIDTVCYCQQKYHRIKSRLVQIMNKIDMRKVGYHFIPITAHYGDNLFDKSKNTPWYCGPILIEAIGQLKFPIKSIEKPLRIPIMKFQRICGVGTIAIGKVVSGVIQSGSKVVIAPLGIEFEVESIQMNYKRLDCAFPNDFVGIKLKNCNWNGFRKGFMIGDIKNNPPFQAETFVAKIKILFHPNSLKKGYCPVIHCNLTSVSCEFVEILSKSDSKGKIIEEKPNSIKSGDTANVLLRPTKPLCCQAFSENRTLGRLILQDERKVVGVGIVLSVNKKVFEK